MKLNKKLIYQWIAVILSAVLSVYIISSLSSCSHAKRAEYHKERFIKNGGRIDCKTDSIIIRDTIKGKDGKDSIIERIIPCNCPELETPPTKWQIKRLDRKERNKYRDSLNHAEKIYKLQTKRLNKLKRRNNDLEKTLTNQYKQNTRNALRLAKNNKKTGFAYNFRMFIFAISGLIVFLFIIFVLYKILKR